VPGRLVVEELAAECGEGAASLDIIRQLLFRTSGDTAVARAIISGQIVADGMRAYNIVPGRQ
jgi:hypothetical protein